MYSTRVSHLVRAPRAAVFQALLDPQAISRWRVPAGMTGRVHTFDPREGGFFRVSLTYTGEGVGKSGDRTDTYAGRFAQIVPGERVTEVFAFESDDPGLRTEMTMTTLLADVPGGTEVTIVHENVSDSVSPADNETGTRMALENLARLVEEG